MSADPRFPGGLSPERAARRERERRESEHMRNAVLRYLKLTQPGLRDAPISNDFINLMITFRQVAARHKDLDWALLPAGSTADLLHDIEGLTAHAKPGNGTLQGGFWPRFGGVR